MIFKQSGYGVGVVPVLSPVEGSALEALVQDKLTGVAVPAPPNDLGFKPCEGCRPYFEKDAACKLCRSCESNKHAIEALRIRFSALRAATKPQLPEAPRGNSLRVRRNFATLDQVRNIARELNDQVDECKRLRSALDFSNDQIHGLQDRLKESAGEVMRLHENLNKEVEESKRTARENDKLLERLNTMTADYQVLQQAAAAHDCTAFKAAKEKEIAEPEQSRDNAEGSLRYISEMLYVKGYRT
jgi:hypothetical protein